MTTFRYFAYGSNMLSTRLRARCPSAVRERNAYASGFSVAFHKRSIDKSGKATLVTSDGTANAARGVVFEIAMSELPKLDDSERGYERREGFFVTCFRAGEPISTYTYLAEKLQPHLKPKDWYLALVIAGINEHELGDDYASELREIKYDVDSVTDRQTRLDAIEAMEQAGIPNYRTLLP